MLASRPNTRFTRPRQVHQLGRQALAGDSRAGIALLADHNALIVRHIPPRVRGRAHSLRRDTNKIEEKEKHLAALVLASIIVTLLFGVAFGTYRSNHGST